MIRTYPLLRRGIIPFSTTKIKMMIMKVTELIKIYKKVSFYVTNYTKRRKIWLEDHQGRHLKQTTQIT